MNIVTTVQCQKDALTVPIPAGWCVTDNSHTGITMEGPLPDNHLYHQRKGRIVVGLDSFVNVKNQPEIFWRRTCKFTRWRTDKNTGRAKATTGVSSTDRIFGEILRNKLT